MRKRRRRATTSPNRRGGLPRSAVVAAPSSADTNLGAIGSQKSRGGPRHGRLVSAERWAKSSQQIPIRTRRCGRPRGYSSGCCRR